MNCEFCNKPFNLTNKLPLILPCCGSTSCKECIINLTGEPQQKVFTCPMKDCGESNQDQSTLKTNRHLEKVLKQSIGIMCDQHQQNQGEFFCFDDQLFICSVCIVSKQKGHSCHPVDKQEIITYNGKVLEFLKAEYERIRKLIGNIEQYQTNETQLSSNQYLKLIQDAQEIVKPRLNEIQQNLIKFPPFKQQEQEEQKVPTQIQQNKQQEVFEIDSKLIKYDDYQLLKEYLNTNNLTLKLLYRGTYHGFTIDAFRQRCDNQGPTLTVALNEHDQLFGGYTSISWQSHQPGYYKQDRSAFLFQLTKKFKFTQYQNQDKAVYHDNQYGPAFGGGCDLQLGNRIDFDKDKSCHSGINRIKSCTYNLPLEVQNNEEEAEKYLAGSRFFKLKEIEVFKVIIK